MEVIYNIMEFILPFDFMQYDFMKNAFLAVIFVSPLLGLLGTMVVNNKMSFFSDALGHSALTGVALGAVIGISDYSISMIIFAIAFALLLNFVKRKSKTEANTIISVFSSTAIAIGLVVLSKYGGINKYSAYLVGDILSITTIELLVLLIALVIITIIWIMIFNKLLAISVNSSLAKTKGINTALIENIFVVLIAVIVMLTIRWVGILLINSLLILPAASSRNISSNVRQYTRLTIAFSLLCGILGLFVSFVFGLATGPTIVVLSAIIYFVSLMLKKN
ncbi:MAG: metal ABC transporter permease [Clostridia bacterium]|nr:metal ABC transporter permease [Clostridia bacterium]